jgi:hypothetical protein
MKMLNEEDMMMILLLQLLMLMLQCKEGVNCGYVMAATVAAVVSEGKYCASADLSFSLSLYEYKKDTKAS